MSALFCKHQTIGTYAVELVTPPSFQIIIKLDYSYCTTKNAWGKWEINGKTAHKWRKNHATIANRYVYECQTPNVRPKSERKVASVKSWKQIELWFFIRYFRQPSIRSSMQQWRVYGTVKCGCGDINIIAILSNRRYFRCHCENSIMFGTMTIKSMPADSVSIYAVIWTFFHIDSSM